MKLFLLKMINAIRRYKLIPIKIKCKKQLPFTQSQLNESILENRNSLYFVENWVDEKSLENSWFNYGVPDFIKADLNKKINNELTYSDVLSYLAKSYFKKVNYLEIGVSVGKNFFQIINSRNNINFALGFDIENIYPIIENKLIFEKKETWKTNIDSIKKDDSHLTQYIYKDKKISYLCGDVFDQKTWERIPKNKFNIIFSDALHTPDAIIFEFDQILKNKLLSEEFIFVWDDLEGEMEYAFYNIIKKYGEKLNIQQTYLFEINGWVGEHERKHKVGLISNIRF